MKILFVFGTRPEIIKLSILIEKCRERFETVLVHTQQHTTIFDANSLIPDIQYYLHTPNNSMNLFMPQARMELDSVIVKEKPDMIIVHGDTMSAYSGALSGFLRKIPVGHVEAGLRTYNIHSPYPEEFFRQSIDKISQFLWCPTQDAYDNLAQERLNGNIYITGNTIVDYLNKYAVFQSTEKTVLVTIHRRENEEFMEQIFTELNNSARYLKDYQFIFPAHPNPIVQNKLYLINAPNITICKPMGYQSFLDALAKSTFVISDSGGIQEESVYFKKKILIVRDSTERPELLNIGLGRLCHYKISDHLDWAISPFEEIIHQPYGTGNASKLIIQSIENYRK